MAIAIRQFPIWADLAHRWRTLRPALLAWAKEDAKQWPLVIPLAFATGIGAWFALPVREQWLGLIIGAVLAGMTLWMLATRWPIAARSLRWCGAGLLIVAAGTLTIWTKSELISEPSLASPWIGTMEGEVVQREILAARGMERYVVKIAQPEGLPSKVRINVPFRLVEDKTTTVFTGDRIRLKVRLMPPGEPALPGGYDFARRAWFAGLGATGSALTAPDVLESSGQGGIASLRSRLSQHIQRQIPGSEGAIAATLATGDRGGISEADAEAMRRSGLAHLLAISGLHVSALIGAVFLLVLKLLALSPTLALRWRLPVVAAFAGALAGIAYTVFTGGAVPTIRACIAALLILLALVLGRDPFSLRLIGFAALVILLIWPETLVGPSFQLSFAAVVAIIALYDAPLMRRWSAERDEKQFGLVQRIGRFALLLFLTGLVIEITLMPIALYHFHKAGIYGALANIVAIPLTTFVIMPLEAMAMLADSIGLGAPFWWLCGKAIGLLLSLAHFVSESPGAIIRFPAISISTYLLAIVAGLILFLLRSPLRLLGLVPAAVAVILMLATPRPDLLIANDGRQIAVRSKTSGSGDFVLLKPDSESFTTDMMREQGAFEDEPVGLDQWPEAQCSREFCSFVLTRSDRDWVVLVSRKNEYVPKRALAAACARSHIVIAGRFLPGSCRPRWRKLDRRYLRQSGGVAIYLDDTRIDQVADSRSDHGWSYDR
ncbi:ComEC/Rec2 family competence protein [Alterisphingorhabdus coralli]|uniref:ComEC/Rec2 family competence protein n=1 Tax=Alterisphingorhabdus coralli TaxID=3071408 RepID=A0AA97F5Z9_9SPHN|nr:ComEC/Rec2 family competence protein [Parasphingorhabdus sp. SCSIO 66989]WOE73943.1 ComEC/Rec2 family competence protein [Parasphingorhabdus sp. SCSIO 66989]